MEYNDHADYRENFKHKDLDQRKSNQKNSNLAEVVSVGEWITTALIMMIPIVNFIMIFVWAFGSKSNPSKANYFKATLLMFAIWLVIMVLCAIILGFSYF